MVLMAVMVLTTTFSFLQINVQAASLSQVTEVSVSAKSTSSAKISWDKVSGATGYQIYRKAGSSGSWAKIKMIKSASTTSYTDTELKTGKTYYYKVRAYKKGATGNSYSSYSDTVKITGGTPAKVTGLSASASAGGKIKLTWTKVSGASGYRIYRKTGSSGTWKKVKTVTSGSTVTYTNTGTPGKTYYYKVCAYNKVSGTVYAGKCSSSVSKKAIAVKKVTGLSATRKSSSSIKLTWTKASGADGYQIWRKSGNGSWTKVKSITSGSTVTYTNTGLDAGTTYTYRVRAYKTVNGTKYYGSYSDTASATTKAVSTSVYTGDADLPDDYKEEIGTIKISSYSCTLYAAKESSTACYQQIIDDGDSALACALLNGVIIQDHNSDGLSVLTSASVGDTATITLSSGTIKLKCTEIYRNQTYTYGYGVESDEIEIITCDTNNDGHCVTIWTMTSSSTTTVSKLRSFIKSIEK